MNELLPGRELDALVCERVFGLVRCRGEKHDASYPNTYCYAATDSPTEGAEARCYSTEINDAWEVVAAMREKYNCLLTLEQYLAAGVNACARLVPPGGPGRRGPGALCPAAARRRSSCGPSTRAVCGTRGRRQSGTWRGGWPAGSWGKAS